MKIKLNKKNKLIILYTLAVTCLVTVTVFSVTLGSVSLSFKEIVSGLLGTSETEKIIIRDLRLPRVWGSVLAGASLSSAGLILQCVTNNPLCAPNIVGINSGAGFAVMLMLCFSPTAWTLIPLGAFVGAFLTTVAVMAIAFSKSSGRSETNLVLTGVAISSILTAGISFLSLKYPDILSSYTAFSVGGFSGVQIKELLIPTLITAAVLLTAYIATPKMTLLYLGDDVALSLGVNVKQLRIFSLILSSLLCASAVSYAGLLGFVGLIVPHISRKLIGNDMKTALPFTAICGATLTTASDLLGRTLFAPSELPAGIIMSFIGAPFFLYLLITRRDNVDRM